MSTLKDVAKLAGVSTATVSYVINGLADEKRITKETQERIKKAILKLNYLPDVTAKRLKNNKLDKYKIGLYWTLDSRAHLLARVLIGIQKVLKESPLPIELSICPYESGHIREKEDLFKFGTHNGVIIGTTSREDMEYIENNIPPMPLVLFDRYLSGENSVYLDNDFAMDFAIDYLIKNGIKNIGVVRAFDPYVSMDNRDSLFISKCRELKINIEDNIIETENSIEGGKAAAIKYMGLPDKPDGLYIGTDTIAHGMIDALKNIYKLPTRRLPKIITMGYYDFVYDIFSRDKITYLDIPLEKMAQESLRVLIEIIGGNNSEGIDLKIKPIVK